MGIVKTAQDFAGVKPAVICNTIKDPHWYAVQVSDTTMITRAPSARKTNNIFKKYE